MIYREFGEMLFTHYGVSGPVLLSASSYAVKELKKGPLSLVIDLNRRCRRNSWMRGCSVNLRGL